MKREEFTFKGKENTDIYYYRWPSSKDECIKGVILILHGMAEHALRYEKFANFLNTHGYVVYACDHRGHGKTGTAMNKMGYFGKGGWDLLVEDVRYLVNIIRAKHEDIPLILFGHSMGSFLARTCISEFGSEFDGVILSGTGNGVDAITRKSALALAKVISFFSGPQKKSPFINHIFFDGYNKRFGDHLEYAWLSRDENEVKKYLDDELCGYICTSSFYTDLMVGINRNAKKSNARKVPVNLPMYIFSGTMDPVGNFTIDVRNTYRLYKNVAKLKNVTLKLYKEGRHEMLNELNNQEVYQDVLNWLEDLRTLFRLATIIPNMKNKIPKPI